MKKNITYKLIPEKEALQSIGIGIEYFPKYINLDPDTIHSLDIILMSFIIKGDVIHHLDRETYHESDLSLSIINYGQQHTITTSKDGAEVVNIYLDLKHNILPILPDELQEVIPLFLPIHINMQNKVNRMVRLNFAEEDNIAPLLKNMANELKAAEIGYEIAIKDYIRLILIKCARNVLQHHFKPATKINSYSEKKIEKLRQFLDKNYKSSPQLTEIAKMTAFSPNYLCKIFKEYTGKTIFEYINERKIQAAMLLLKTTSKQIIEIADIAGFNDLSHFNHLFKRITGTSPNKYRGDRS